MKNFKFKLNFLFNLLKKNKVLKKTNIFLDNTKKLLKLDNIKKKIFEKNFKSYIKNFKINYLFLFASIIFFWYLIYLSFPGILHNKSDQHYFTKILKEQYIWNFRYHQNRHSILPRHIFKLVTLLYSISRMISKKR